MSPAVIGKGRPKAKDRQSKPGQHAGGRGGWVSEFEAGLGRMVRPHLGGEGGEREKRL